MTDHVSLFGMKALYGKKLEIFVEVFAVVLFAVTNVPHFSGYRSEQKVLKDSRGYKRKLLVTFKASIFYVR